VALVKRFCHLVKNYVLLFVFIVVIDLMSGTALAILFQIYRSLGGIGGYYLRPLISMPP